MDFADSQRLTHNEKATAGRLKKHTYRLTVTSTYLLNIYILLKIVYEKFIYDSEIKKLNLKNICFIILSLVKKMIYH